MKMFSDCSGECKDCKYLYIEPNANCLAGHGDDYFEPVVYDELNDDQKSDYDKRHNKND